MEPYDPDWMRQDLQKPLRSQSWAERSMDALIEQLEEVEENTLELEQSGLRAHIEFGAEGEDEWPPELKTEFSRNVLQELQQELTLALAQLDSLNAESEDAYGLVGVFGSRQLEMDGYTVFASIQGGGRATFTTVVRSEGEDQVMDGGSHTVEMGQIALFVRPPDERLEGWLEPPEDSDFDEAFEELEDEEAKHLDADAVEAAFEDEEVEEI